MVEADRKRDEAWIDYLSGIGKFEKEKTREKYDALADAANEKYVAFSEAARESLAKLEAYGN